MNVLVTGGAGFIGHHVVKRLVSLGHKVEVLDVRDKPAINWSYVENLIGEENLHLGSVTSYQTVSCIFKNGNYDLCLHLAAQSHVDRSIANPSSTIHTNVIGTQVIASACCEYNVPLVYCSTDEVYGDAIDHNTGKLQCFYECDRLNPSSPYSAGKASGELVVKAAGRTHGLRWAITRGTNAFGPGQYPEKLIPIMLHHLQTGKPVPLHGGGGQMRQWVHVEEFADCLVVVGFSLLAGHREVVSGTFNIAGPEIHSVANLVDIYKGLISPESDEVHFKCVADRPGQDRAYFVSADALERAVGIRPKRSIVDSEEAAALIAAYPPDGDVISADYGEVV